MILVLLQLAALFGTLSLLAFGGGNGVLPAMQHAAVDLHHWMTDRQFLDLFAISRASPGPGSLIVVLVGQRAAGLAGAVVAGLAMYVPSSLVVFIAAKLWRRAQDAPWRARLERALAPVAVGLTYASGLALLQGTEHDWRAWVLTALATLLLAFTEVNPMLPLAGGAALALVLGM
jgi:chromate transporter